MVDQTLNATIVKKTLLTPDLYVIRIKPEGWQIPDFKPGQYCAIGLPGCAPRCKGSQPEAKTPDPEKLVRRAYSIASAPSDKEALELFITLVPEGALTPRLFSLNEGDKLWVNPKVVGMFTLDGVPDDAHLILLSTGTGLAPYISMIREGLFQNPKRRVVVVHGVRHSFDLGYLEELKKLEATKPFHHVPLVSRPKQEKTPWTGETGHVQDVWSRKVIDGLWGFHPEPKNTHFFMCGNPAMIKTMMDILGKEGFIEHTRRQPGQMHVEKYW